jgi:hypothetical protein
MEGALKALKKLKKLNVCEIGSVKAKLTLVCEEDSITSVGVDGGLVPSGQT